MATNKGTLSKAFFIQIFPFWVFCFIVFCIFYSFILSLHSSLAVLCICFIILFPVRKFINFIRLIPLLFFILFPAFLLFSEPTFLCLLPCLFIFLFVNPHVDPDKWKEIKNNCNLPPFLISIIGGTAIIGILYLVSPSLQFVITFKNHTFLPTTFCMLILSGILTWYCYPKYVRYLKTQILKSEEESPEEQDENNKNSCFPKVVAAIFLLVLCACAGWTNILTWSEIYYKHISSEEAKIYCKNLNEGGYGGWTLPNIEQLKILKTEFKNSENDSFSRLGDDVALWASGVDIVEDEDKFDCDFYHAYRVNFVNFRSGEICNLCNLGYFDFCQPWTLAEQKGIYVRCVR